MKKYTKIFLALSVALITAKSSFSQSGILQEAEKAWYAGDYFNAAKFYNQYVTGKADSIERPDFNPYAHATGNKKKNTFATNAPGRVTWRLAESYRMMHDYTNAEDWYAKVSTENAAEFPLAQYWYGVSLRANEKFEQAETVLDNFSKTYKGNDVYSDGAARELKNLRFTNSQMKKGITDIYTVHAFEGTGLTSKGNFAAVKHGENVVFTGVYTDSSAFKKKSNPYFNRLYEVPLQGATSAVVMEVNGATASLNQGTAAFTPDGKGLYFTQWEKKNGKTSANLYFANVENGKASNAVPVQVLNRSGFNSFQPFVSSDGRYLLFSSNRPGGFGGYDIWYAALENGQPKDTALNLGRVINTSADEQTPFYAPGIGRLVFSTNGRTGMGGFDLFSAKGTIDKWNEPVNMGYPINSPKDDQYFYSSSDNIFSEAWFSSDRGSDCCLELYTATQLPRNKTLVGTLLDCATGKPLTRGMIYITDANGSRTDSTFTDRDGKYILSVGLREQVKLLAEKTAYDSKNADVSIAELSQVDDVNDVLTNADICLQPQPEKNLTMPRIIRDRVIYFDFDKSNLKPAAVQELNAMVATLKEFPEAVFEVGGYTDEQGTDDYNIKLGFRRATSAAEYLKAHGIAENRIQIKSYGKLYGAKGVSKEESGKWNRKVRMVILSGKPESN